MKVYAFIDGQNLNLGTKYDGWQLDFRKFRLYLKHKYLVEKAFLFIGYVKENKRLYKFLRRCGFILIFKPISKYKNFIKGNVDVELVLYAMLKFKMYDKAVIVTGDGDFYSLIKYLERKGKLLKILVPNNRYSRLLRKFNKNKYIVLLSLLKSQLKIKKRGTRDRSKP